eukprot:CAMPEP_0172210350 /NCGR_PEP_ID=MMETSP1050-20130122/35694_1 /TAXON_ID=233186 /ORGANISM="Cryptomonas curvata, Strain CCAP979/52" /LENGTH=96 /DNA_ID=CAMNT_0012890473 /DNA_START=208 /DNA_END=496 /DNA_ORIENTATION=-
MTLQKYPHVILFASPCGFPIVQTPDIPSSLTCASTGAVGGGVREHGGAVDGAVPDRGARVPLLLGPQRRLLDRGDRGGAAAVLLSDVPQRDQGIAR